MQLDNTDVIHWCILALAAAISCASLALCDGGIEMFDLPVGLSLVCTFISYKYFIVYLPRLNVEFMFLSFEFVIIIFVISKNTVVCVVVVVVVSSQAN